MAGATNFNAYPAHLNQSTRTTRSSTLAENPLEALKVRLKQLILHTGCNPASIRMLDLTGITKQAITDIPAGTLTELGFENLEEVILSENDFSDIPVGIRELKVTKLVVDLCPNLNKLTGIKEMGVEELEAEYCGFTAWPEELNDSSVTHINLIGNKITSIPAYPKSLEVVHISGVKESIAVWDAATGCDIFVPTAVGLPIGANALDGDFVEEPYVVEGETNIKYTKYCEQMDISGNESDEGFLSRSDSDSTPQYTPPITPEYSPIAGTNETPQGFRDVWEEMWNSEGVVDMGQDPLIEHLMQYV